jgi:probable rRNA maturation factor
MINIVINDEYIEQIQEDILIKSAEVVVKLAGISDEIEMSVVVEDDEQLRDLNLRFLGIDAPTDVLSFPADEIDPDSGLRILGDVIISLPRAKEQAAAANEKLEDELQLLVIHGTLHLLGHDHTTPEEKSAMWQAQQRALDELGCKITRLPE